MISLAAYLLLFLAVGIGFILVHLLAGKLIRPNKPDAEKGTIYECGEPTIGSAWVQFDLRFYVVALLFVIFDVEVAFFFPWAEVFGKSNAIANAPVKAPKTAKEYREWAATVLELAPPVADPPAQAQRKRWEKMRRLKDEELAAFEALTPKQRVAFGSLREAEIEALQTATAEQTATAPRVAAALRKALGEIRTEQEKKLRDLGATDAEIKSELSQVDRAEQVSSLRELAAGVTMLPGVRQAQGPAPQPALYTRLRQQKKDDEALKFANAQQARVVAEGKKALAAMNNAGPAQAALWGALSLPGLDAVGDLTADQRSLLPDLHADAMRAINEATQGRFDVGHIKEDARELSWLALGEVLVFFGVLLVGFAYLWRRGDIEWVRSTAAERVEANAPPTSPPAPAPAREPVSAS